MEQRALLRPARLACAGKFGGSPSYPLWSPGWKAGFSDVLTYTQVSSENLHHPVKTGTMSPNPSSGRTACHPHLESPRTGTLSQGSESLRQCL